MPYRARVFLFIALVPLALFVLILMMVGAGIVIGTLNGTYNMPTNEPNRLYIVPPAARPGRLLFLAYRCAGGQRRILRDNTWTISFDHHGLACTIDAPLVANGGLHGAELYRDAHGTYPVAPFFGAVAGTALYDLTDLQVRGWCGNAAAITITVFVWGYASDKGRWEARKRTGVTAFTPALHAACVRKSPTSHG